MDKLAQAEVLVDYILEQGFSVTVALSNLNGNAEVDWTQCYKGKCTSLKNEFQRSECKAQCEWKAYNLLISRMNALRSRCREATNQTGCTKTIQNAVDVVREKQKKAREMMAKSRAKAAEYNRTQAQNQNAQQQGR